MNKLNKLYLIGFMGAGKSTAGKILSSSIGYNFIDLDSTIEESSKKKITDIFSEMGEDFFRNLETEILTKVSGERGNAVISTGGGIVLKPCNMKIIKSSGTSIYLKTDIKTIWERVKEDKGRPLLNVENPFSMASELLSSRLELYEKADFMVETDNLSPRKISERIVELVFN